MEEEDLWKSESFHSQVKEHYIFCCFRFANPEHSGFQRFRVFGLPRKIIFFFSDGSSFSPIPDTCSIWLKIILTSIFRNTLCSNFFLCYRIHYEKKLKQKTLEVWQDIWWSGRKGWKLNVRADYHNRWDTKNEELCILSSRV